MEELGVQRGEWINKSDIHKYYDRMENWLQLITKKMFLS
jgi:predicted NUDIX family phosphoesterase